LAPIIGRPIIGQSIIGAPLKKFNNFVENKQLRNAPVIFQSVVYRNHSVWDFPVAECTDEIHLQPRQIVYLTTPQETQLHSK